FNWTPRNSIVGHALNAVAFGSDTVVAVGDFGTIVQSDHWSRLQLEWPGPVLTLSGEVGQSYRMLWRDDLSPMVLWIVGPIVTLTNSPQRWDPGFFTLPARFYQAITWP
ncbi:MAG TPA: hypothetical protein VGP94_15310, partial [Tepidisphaeraceae bacterium]|nr:hypothetical protein [Tepidisphaeraceae bacterium]